MEATHLLREEHEVITRVIEALESAAHAVEHGGKISPSFSWTLLSSCAVLPMAVTTRKRKTSSSRPWWPTA